MRQRRHQSEDDLNVAISVSGARREGSCGSGQSCVPELSRWGGDFGGIMSITSMKLTALFMKVPEGYVAFIEELPGANTQGATLDEARENLREAVALVLDANRAMSEQSLEGAAVIRETFVLPAA